MKRILCMLLLLCLLCTGCTQEPAATPLQPEEPTVSTPEPTGSPEIPPEEEAEPEPETLQPLLPDNAAPAYLFEGTTQNSLIAPDGTVILSSSHPLSLLYDRNTNRFAGLMERCSEGIVYDEYGWASAERTWCNLYDLSGGLLHSFPLNYVSVCGNWAYGYRSETGTSSIYRLSDGTLYLDNLNSVWDLGGILAFRQNSWEDPCTLLLPDGTLIPLPADLEPSRVLWDEDTAYLAIYNEQYQLGLATLSGEHLLECRFENALTVQDGKVILTDDTTTWSFDLQTGMLEPFAGGRLVNRLFSECAIVQTGKDPYTYAMADLNGNLLTPDGFPYLSTIDNNADEEPELVYGTLETEDSSRVFCFQPDGILLQIFDLDANYFTPLTSSHALLSEQRWDEATQTSSGTYSLIDLKTGEPLRQWDGESLFISPLYYYAYSELDESSRGYLMLNQKNELGWQRYSLLNELGEPVLENCSSILYRGNGVVQVEQGFTSGLMTLNGAWLYQESSFSALEDS